MTKGMKQKTAFIMVLSLVFGMLSGFASAPVSEAAGGETDLPEPVPAAYVQPVLETSKPMIATSRPKRTPIPATAQPGESGNELNNPRTDADGIVTWDCVYFGNYWQEDTNGDGIADQEDEKMPMKWRVLSVDGNDAFLLADKNIDCQKYNDTWTDVTWETCTMRSWLNDTFLNIAFSAGEQSAIKDSNVVNEDNSEYDVDGGNDTLDKVYLLSIDEVTDPVYGFSSLIKEDEARRAKDTEYAKAQRVEDGYWWLRSPGIFSNIAAYVDFNGYVDRYGFNVSHDDVCARPVLHLNLSSTSSWSYAGTVTAERKEIETATPASTNEPIPATADPNATPGPTNTLNPATSKPIRTPIPATVDPNATPGPTNTPIPATESPAETAAPGLSFNGYEYSVDGDGGICITKYNGSEKELVIPGEIDGKKVTSIGKMAFGDLRLKSVTIPDSVITIEEYAFYQNWMQSLTIPDSVTSIGEYAFWFCTSLKSVTIPASVTSIKSTSFFYCHDDLVIWTTRGSYADRYFNASKTVKYIEEPAEPTSTPGQPADPSSPTPAPVIPQSPAQVQPQAPVTPDPEVKKATPQDPAKVKKPTVKVKKKSVQLNWKKVSGVTGYEIWISGSKNFSKKTVKKSKTAKFTMKGLKRNRTYYVKIRAYTKAGRKVKYGKWSKVEKVKCK